MQEFKICVVLGLFTTESGLQKWFEKLKRQDILKEEVKHEADLKCFSAVSNPKAFALVYLGIL